MCVCAYLFVLFILFVYIHAYAMQVMRWLAAVDNSGLNHLPIIGNAQKNTNEQSKGKLT